MIEKLLIIVFLLSPTALSSSLTEINKSSESPETSQLNQNIPEDPLLIKRLKKQIARDNYDLTRENDEGEVDENIADYYAQRKVVTDRHRAKREEMCARNVGHTVDDGTSGYPRNDANNAIPGYQRLGHRTHSSDENKLLQRNFRVGANGRLQLLETDIDVELNDGTEINCVEIIPKWNYNVSLEKVSGGLGQNKIKLRLTSEPNPSSHDIIVWGDIPCYDTFGYLVEGKIISNSN